MDTQVQSAGAPAPAQEKSQLHEDKLREAVAAAYDKAEKEAPVAPTPAGAKPAPAAGAKPAPARGEDGKFKKSEGATPAAPAALPDQGGAAAAPAPAAAAPPVVKAEGEPEVTEDGKAKPQLDRAPQSWKPAARLHWAKLPPEVKADVMRLERERENVLRETVGARRLADTFTEVVRPYEGFIRAAGHTPMQSVAELMKTAAALRTLPDWDRAQLVAGIVRAHSINPEYLYAALSGQGPLPGAQPAQQDFRDPRVDQLMAELEATRGANEQVATSKADAELDAFIVKHPLAGDLDVQERMARAIDLAASDGLDLSYEEAYTGVLAVDPELRGLAEQQAATNAPQASTAQAEAAASSVSPSPVAAAPASLRGKPLDAHVRAAYDKVSGQA